MPDEKAENIELILGQEEPTGADQEKTEKKFSQSELDGAIKARIEREKLANRKALDALSTDKTTLESQLTDANGLLEKYRQVISQRVASNLEKLPENIRELVSKLDPLEQLEWLDKNAGTFSPKQGIPSVPDPSNGRIQIDDLIAKKKSSGIY